MTELGSRFAYTARPIPPYDFRLTVRKPAGWPLFTPFEVYADSTLWSALRVGGTLIGVRLSNLGTVESPRIRVSLSSREALSAYEREHVASALNSRLGFDEDLGPFYAMARNDQILKHVVSDLYGMHGTDMGDVFSGALLAISLQMTSMPRSNAMMECMIKRYGEAAAFDGRRVMFWPTPKRLAAFTPQQLAESCKLGYRAKFISALSKRLASEPFPSVEELKAMGPADAKRLLMGLPGIGDYSSDIVSPHGGFPIDVWSADIFGKLFFGREPRNGRAAIERIKSFGMKRWGRWSWMAFYYVAQDLENLSRKLGISLRLT